MAAGTGKAYLRSFAMGVFYGALVLVADRCFNLRGGIHVTLLVAMTIASLIIVISTIKVDPESRFHIPLKPLGILVGFLLGIAMFYAFLGNMPGHRNIVQQIAEKKSLPPALQSPLDQYVAWSAKHSLIGNGPPAKVLPLP